jgi:hypothetical protein
MRGDTLGGLRAYKERCTGMFGMSYGERCKVGELNGGAEKPKNADRKRTDRERQSCGA